MIVTTRTHGDGCKIHTLPGRFESVDGFTVIRLPYVKYKISLVTSIMCKLPVYDYLVEIQPDYIFFHGLSSVTILDVIRYKKQCVKQGSKCVIVQDNHMDTYNIGKTGSKIKDTILREYYKCLNRKSQKYVSRIYGVTPIRQQFAEEYFNIAHEKTDLLLMGADDEKIDFNHRDEIRNCIRKKYNIKDNEFLIVTGGKIDEKKKIHLLAEACGGLKDVKLLIFGSVVKEMQEQFSQLTKKYKNIIYIGWVESSAVYNYFFASDLVCFPGGHSVLWEQACACKIPCVFNRLTGMEHVNNGGNATFFDKIDVDTIRRKIKELLFTEQYYVMKSIAQSNATDIYLYSEIAKKSLEWADVSNEVFKE